MKLEITGVIWSNVSDEGEFMNDFIDWIKSRNEEFTGIIKEIE